ncbi:MAG: hypothetical protein A2W22_01790 [Candidatus Levybacteria bacterium RBG_16_35_11]|nr:MAG: hypothetical protein A2W22_01790 [Candidatus Levybacteria bacterium RBG_16_35_11]
MPNVIVAVIHPGCFRTVQEYGFYGAGFLTGGEHRNAPETDYLAFYITHPTSAVTHYARVRYRQLNVPEADTHGWYNRDENTDPNSKFEEHPWIHTAYYIENLLVLPRPIHHNGYIMRFGRKITTLDRLLNAHIVADLFP